MKIDLQEIFFLCSFIIFATLIGVVGFYLFIYGKVALDNWLINLFG